MKKLNELKKMMADAVDPMRPYFFFENFTAENFIQKNELRGYATKQLVQDAFDEFKDEYNKTKYLYRITDRDLSYRADFDRVLQSWVRDNQQFIDEELEAGGSIVEFFDTCIQSETYHDEEGAEVEYTDDIEYAHARIEFHYQAICNRTE